MELLKLIKPTKDFEKKVLDMIQEFYDDNTTFYGSGGLKKFVDNYTGWLEYLRQNEREDSVSEGYIPGVQYILVHEPNNSVIGFINARFRLNETLLQHGGHIGYSIRPSERKKHYATAQLFKILENYKNLGVEKVLLTCDKNNIGSAKTIQNCGGILENEIIDPVDGELIQRYWIDVEEGIKKGDKFFENNNFIVELI